jgi:hypothetical protein
MEKAITAAVKIQRVWRNYRSCPYCNKYSCNGFYNQFNCSEMWDVDDLRKLDDYLDRLAGY